MLRALLALVVVASAAWSGLWWSGARETDRALRAWLAGPHAAGWTVRFDDLQTRGFPNRFDTRVSGPDLELAGARSGWKTPFVEMFRLSYQPRHVIAVLSNTQTLSLASGEVQITTSDARASARFAKGAAWPLDRATVSVADLGIVFASGATASLGSGLLASRRSESIPGGADIAFDLQNLRPAAPILARLEDLDLVPGTVARIRLDASVSLDRPLDRRAVEEAWPDLQAFDLRRAEITWGRLVFWAAGEMAFDADGRANGSITLKLTNWRDMVALARAGDWLSPRLLNALETALDALSGLAGSSKTLDVPLTFRSGRVSLGPVPLGRVPALR